MCLGACTIRQRFKIVLELLDGDLESLLVGTPGIEEIITLYQRLLLAKVCWIKDESTEISLLTFTLKQTALGINWLHSADPAVIHRYEINMLIYLPNLLFLPYTETSSLKTCW